SCLRPGRSPARRAAPLLILRGPTMMEPLKTRFAVVALVLLGLPVVASAKPPDAAALAFFEAKIRPILFEHCYKCHSVASGKPRAGLKLASAAGLLKGGTNGPAIVPGDPGKSLLLKAVRHEGGLTMPSKGKKLPAAVVRDFEVWVKMGAPDPRQGKPNVKGADPRKFWAFQRPVRLPAAAVKDASWVTSEIDAFILAGLEKRGLRPAP